MSDTNSTTTEPTAPVGWDHIAEAIIFPDTRRKSQTRQVNPDDSDADIVVFVKESEATEDHQASTTAEFDEAWSVIEDRIYEIIKGFESIREHIKSLRCTLLKAANEPNPKVVFLSLCPECPEVDFPAAKREIQQYLESSFPQLGLEIRIELEEGETRGVRVVRLTASVQDEHSDAPQTGPPGSEQSGGVVTACNDTTDTTKAPKTTSTMDAWPLIEYGIQALTKGLFKSIIANITCATCVQAKTSSEVTPNEGTPNEGTPNKRTTNKATPKEVAPKELTLTVQAETPGVDLPAAEREIQKFLDCCFPHLGLRVIINHEEDSGEDHAVSPNTMDNEENSGEDHAVSPNTMDHEEDTGEDRAVSPNTMGHEEDSDEEHGVSSNTIDHEEDSDEDIEFTWHSW
ncbi:hypothetical protein V8F20_008571 [Naviculisporaceae sp. PSN 640]